MFTSMMIEFYDQTSKSLASEVPKKNAIAKLMLPLKPPYRTV